MSAWANVAKLTKAKTLEGGLFVQSTKGLPFLLEEGMEVTFVPPLLRFPRSSRIVQLDHKGEGKYLVYFEDITSIDLAEQLVGHYCLVRKADLPEDYDRSSHDLLTNFSVLSDKGVEVGSVVRVDENPAHPLLVVLRNGREVLIPLVDELLLGIDEQNNTITMSIPEGLLEL